VCLSDSRKTQATFIHSNCMTRQNTVRVPFRWASGGKKCIDFSKNRSREKGTGHLPSARKSRALIYLVSIATKVNNESTEAPRCVHCTRENFPVWKRGEFLAAFRYISTDGKSCKRLCWRRISKMRCAFDQCLTCSDGTVAGAFVFSVNGVRADRRLAT